METKVLTAHVPLSLSRKVDELAARLERSRDWIVKQALADVDAGLVIGHQSVQAWADGLGARKPRPPPRR